MGRRRSTPREMNVHEFVTCREHVTNLAAEHYALPCDLCNWYMYEHVFIPIFYMHCCINIPRRRIYMYDVLL